MGIEEIKKDLETVISELNDQSNKLDMINSSFKAFYEKNISELIDRCEYRIGTLEIAHKFPNVADHNEIEKNTSELNSTVASLNNEVMDLETIKKDISVQFGIESYDAIAKSLVDLIDRQLDDSNRVIKRATAILNNNFEEVEEKVTGEVKEKEEVIPEHILNQREIKVDRISELMNGLNNDMKEFQQDKKELEEASRDLGEPIKVTSVEEAKEDTISPILKPQENPDLEGIFATRNSNVPEKMESAENVETGFVLVTDVRTFDEEKKQENQGPVLTRTI